MGSLHLLPLKTHQGTKPRLSSANEGARRQAQPAGAWCSSIPRWNLCPGAPSGLAVPQSQPVLLPLLPHKCQSSRWPGGPAGLLRPLSSAFPNVSLITLLRASLNNSSGVCCLAPDLTKGEAHRNTVPFTSSCPSRSVEVSLV